ncbi:signal peptide peptidase SppA, 36K type [Acinetobacter modestus]|uniref:Signal peptide peptidase SppA, 36K type n=1 Tax=Acinetobacter modestus TaxID=1776740 RepID=N9LX46_9GAMM|nr:S49 family peptidase [Acinetobacter modestus]ENX00898.1 signal peptide peptidase SppA, 36K type [Acinetobacter modestus]
MKRFGFLAQRLFNVPLAVHPAKAEVVIAALSEKLGISHIQRAAMMEDDDYEFSSPARKQQAGYEVVAGIAIIQIEGTLVQKLGSLRPYSGMTGYDGIRQNLYAAINDPDVKAIMLDICSPGGEVAGCFDLVDAIYEIRGKKPIWAILNEYAYSAGYAIASAADYITVPRTGGVGSIGVITMHIDMSKAIDAAGLKVTFINFGERKTDGASELELAPEALARFQSDINQMGELFVNTVARNRNLDAEKVKKTEAATFLGQNGVDLGLADAVMSPDAAFAALYEKIK